MPIAPPGTPQVYPSIEDVMVLARVFLNDTLGPGAGNASQAASTEALQVTAPAGGNFSVPHGLSAAPLWISILMTSGGAIWAQTPAFDATNIYLSASDVGVTAQVTVGTALTGNGPGVVSGGIVFPDSAPEALPLLNASIAQFQRDLWNRSVPTMVRELVIPSIPPINSNLGPGAPNAAVWQSLGYTGFNDGLVQYANILLPADLLVPIKVWYRASGTNLTFCEMSEAADGLQSMYQAGTPGDWEWMGDQIGMNGSTQTIDLRIRYLGTVAYYASTTPVAAFPNTKIPFRDSVQALAYRVAYDFAAARVQSGGANDLLANYQACVDGIVQRQVRRMQHVIYERDAYGSTGDVFGWFG